MTKRKDPKDIKPSGRPSKYRPEYDRMVYDLCLLGKKDEDIAPYFAVSVHTLQKWKQYHPTFLQSVRRGRELADTEVVCALRQRAVGMTVEEVHEQIDSTGKKTIKIVKKQIPPDSTAIIYWLNNRQRPLWANRAQIVSGGGLDNQNSIVFKIDYGDKSALQSGSGVSIVSSEDTKGPAQT